MEQPISSQLIVAVISLAWGVFFGLIYDLFKALRLFLARLWFTVASDLFICFLGGAVIFLNAMWAGGGEPRLYMFICSALGALLYFILASRFFLEIFSGFLSLIEKFFHILSLPLRRAAEIIKKFGIYIKKSFQNSALWYRIKNRSTRGKQEIADEDAPTVRGNYHEAEKSKSHNKNNHRRRDRVRRD
ncbi:MAG: spore cortex biosynthesis protein YabQ [Oscillospiraceae bacterium]